MMEKMMMEKMMMEKMMMKQIMKRKQRAPDSRKHYVDTEKLEPM